MVTGGEERLRGLGARRVAAVLDGDDAGAVAFWRAAGYAPQPAQRRFVRSL